jgi:hypothetical protein
MPFIIIIGSTLVTLALLSYSIGIMTEQLKHLINIKILSFITAGLILDISATTCMIIGSANSPFTLHGFIGYIGLLAMMVETYLAWRFYKTKGPEQQVTPKLHLYSRLAYIIWVSVYITGILLVTLK